MEDQEIAGADTAGAAEPPTEKVKPGRRIRPPRQNGAPAGGGMVYVLGMIGAMVYFFRSAESGRDQLLAIPMASVWPALLVYKLLKSFYG